MSNFFDEKEKVLGHPAALFVLFFTEMWERFSFYGMRVLLINFLTMAVIGSNPGWEWSSANAGALFGTYAGLLYLTPILGGFIADKFTGYRWAVVIGALIMTLGHASMALETELSLYLGLALLVIGTGFFKPCITSIISGVYQGHEEKKDGAFTIFYMGVNAGAFFGMMLCGYLAETVGWSWGFGLAGIFMLIGTVQFWLASPVFGKIGEAPKKLSVEEQKSEDDKPKEKLNHFTLVDKILTAICVVVGFLYLINDPTSKIANVNLLPSGEIAGIPAPIFIVLIALGLFLFLVISRITRYENVIRNRMIALIILAFFTVFFWMSFEQGASSLVLFARDFTDRTLSGGYATLFNIVNTLLTVVPLAIISWVLFLLFRRTYKKIPLSNITLSISFLIIWGVVFWMLERNLNSTSYNIDFKAIEIKKTNENGKEIVEHIAIDESYKSIPTDVIVEHESVIEQKGALQIGEEIEVLYEKGSYKHLTPNTVDRIHKTCEIEKRDSHIIHAKVVGIRANEVEVTTSWFSILNSFFIIAFASIFSKWWESKYNPSGPIKYALGLIIMGLGFGILAFGSQSIPSGAEAGAVRVSMVWLILAYLFHTLGELCLSPLGLSYVSKLVPARMIAFMFGMWYVAIAIGNKLAGSLGGMIEEVTSKYDMTTFFLIFTLIPILAGLLVAALNPVLKKLMHGVR